MAWSEKKKPSQLPLLHKPRIPCKEKNHTSKLLIKGDLNCKRAAANLLQRLQYIQQEVTRKEGNKTIKAAKEDGATPVVLGHKSASKSKLERFGVRLIATTSRQIRSKPSKPRNHRTVACIRRRQACF